MVSVFTVSGAPARMQTTKAAPSEHLARRSAPKRDATPKAGHDSRRSAVLASVPSAEPSASGDWTTF